MTKSQNLFDQKKNWGDPKLLISEFVDRHIFVVILVVVVVVIVVVVVVVDGDQPICRKCRKATLDISFTTFLTNDP